VLLEVCSKQITVPKLKVAGVKNKNYGDPKCRVVPVRRNLNDIKQGLIGCELLGLV